MACLELQGHPESVPQARRFVRATLRDWALPDVVADTELLVSELVGNLVIHAPGPGLLDMQRVGATGVRIGVSDGSPVPPVRSNAGANRVTGRGLNLVRSLALSWGFGPREDGRAGKVVWAVLDARPLVQPLPEPPPDLDLEQLLAAYDEPLAVEQRYTVTVGDAPTALLSHAKDHLDGLLRELTLASGYQGDQRRPGAAALPAELVQDIQDAVRRFTPARTQIRMLLSTAMAEGADRVRLTFTLPVSMAAAGEAFLSGLANADDFARDSRMLSLESPVEYRVLREWYVSGLAAALRDAADGRHGSTHETFEHRLVAALGGFETRLRASELAAQLQHVTSRLAGAETVEDIARIAITEGVGALGASGGTVTRRVDGSTVSLAEAGSDEGLGAAYLAQPMGVRPAGPSSLALRQRAPVWVESRADRDRRFPHLAELQPEISAVAALPLLVAGDLVGGLRLSFDSPRVFSASERAYLEGLAAQTAQALARAVALERLRKVRDDANRALRTLEQMADALVSLDRCWAVTYVNREAERLLDRSRFQVLGRVLWEQFPELVGSRFEAEAHATVARRAPVRFEQYVRALGKHLEVRLFPADDGVSVYLTDVEERRADRMERDRATERLRLLNSIGEALSATLDVDEALTRLAALLVPSLADLVSVDIRDEDDVRGAREVVMTASDPSKALALRDADLILPRRNNPASAVHAVLHGRPFVRLAITPEHLRGVAKEQQQLQLYLDIEMRSALVVPLSAHGRVFGVLSLLRTGADAVHHTDDDVEFALEVGRRAGLMIDNAAQYTAQRAVAETLQRSLLPELPQVPGVLLGAAYEPSSSQSEVGGDWYDAFVLPDGALGLVIGDVMGHDIQAAAAMGQLQSVLRTCAFDGDSPAAVLDRLDRLVSSFAMADLATVVYARLVRRQDGSGRLTWANAGHPAPLLVCPDGTARFLEQGRSTMIGAPCEEPRDEGSCELPAGARLLMFTDGLVERRGTDPDDQLDALRATALQAGREDVSAGQLCRLLVSRVQRDSETDDAAAIAVQLT